MDLLSMKPLQDANIPMMEAWLKKEHVKKWYENPEDWLLEIRERLGEFSFIKHFIVYFGEQPIGFCQYYPCCEAGEDWYGDLPLEGTYSIDYLIGEEEYIGKGLGKATIKLLTAEVFSITRSQRIIVQPDAENTASCQSLLANGFEFDADRSIFIKYNPCVTPTADENTQPK